MNGVEGTIFTLMAAYVVFIDSAGLALVVAGVGGGAWEAIGRRGRGKKRQRGGCLRQGGGEGSLGPGGEEAGAIL